MQHHYEIHYNGLTFPKEYPIPPKEIKILNQVQNLKLSFYRHIKLREYKFNLTSKNSILPRRKTYSTAFLAISQRICQHQSTRQRLALDDGVFAQVAGCGRGGRMQARAGMPIARAGRFHLRGWHGGTSSSCATGLCARSPSRSRRNPRPSAYTAA